ncbi:DUF4145 domain-containing protein [uncultured Megasphaera sp.]|uniref:DUF4145 domain-containing protein n=1 Tax=uncultured Megasphaera sp. TaxID=165188 RepID=UPI002595B82A|nr:DUF4145 domain-containing protein [uncultured Megasphaera sp.]
MSIHYCPYCHKPFTLIKEQTFHVSYVPITNNSSFSSPFFLILRMMKCPECNRFEIIATPNEHLENLNKGFPCAKHIYPAYSQGQSLPDYIPMTIQNDYHEAYSILELSPKASATLARRCMQGIIRDFWQVSKGTLAQEINAIQDRVDPATQKALNSLRQLGNIGAHMEKDVNTIIDIDDGEAKTLLKFIEYLIQEWYVHRHEQTEMLNKITDINQTKQNLRQP